LPAGGTGPVAVLKYEPCIEIRAIIKTMATIRIPEAEAAKNFAAIMSHVRAGAEVAIEENGETVALVTRPTKRPGRLLSESIALAEARGSTATLDGGFERDLMEFIDSHREPLEPPAWD